MMMRSADGRLLVCSMGFRDARAHVTALHNDAEVAERLPGAAPTVPQLLRAMAFRQLRATIRRRAVEPMEFVVRDATTLAFLGSVSLHSFDRTHKRAELGCWFLRAGRGRGLATEAVRLVRDQALGPIGLERLEITTAPENRSALRLALRLGFEEEGLLRRRNIEGGRRVDVTILGLTRA